MKPCWLNNKNDFQLNYLYTFPSDVAVQTWLDDFYLFDSLLPERFIFPLWIVFDKKRYGNDKFKAAFKKPFLAKRTSSEQSNMFLYLESHSATVYLL